MSTIYTPEYFLKKFEAIPEELWCQIGVKDAYKKDVYGHCGAPYKIHLSETPEAFALLKLFEREISLTPGAVSESIYKAKERYPQPTPKLRILAALTDIINKQKQS